MLEGRTFRPALRLLKSNQMQGGRSAKTTHTLWHHINRIIGGFYMKMPMALSLPGDEHTLTLTIHHPKSSLKNGSQKISL